MNLTELQRRARCASRDVFTLVDALQAAGVLEPVQDEAVRALYRDDVVVLDAPRLDAFVVMCELCGAGGAVQALKERRL